MKVKDIIKELQDIEIRKSQLEVLLTELKSKKKYDSYIGKYFFYDDTDYCHILNIKGCDFVYNMFGYDDESLFKVGIAGEQQINYFLKNSKEVTKKQFDNIRNEVIDKIINI